MPAGHLLPPAAGLPSDIADWIAWMWGALLAASMAAWLDQLTARAAGEDIWQATASAAARP